MSDEYGKYQKLIHLLFEKTQKDELSWELEPWSNRLQCKFGSHTVALFSKESPDGEPYIYLSVINAHDDEIDTIYDSELSDLRTGDQDFPTYWLYMTKLYKMANRKAKGIDRALDDILSHLDDNVPF